MMASYASLAGTASKLSTETETPGRGDAKWKPPGFI
jgi:hypothetical protein